MLEIIDPKDSPFSMEKLEAETYAASPHGIAVCSIAPITPGHTLIISKRIVTSMTELADDELCDIAIFSRHVTTVLMNVFGVNKFGWTIQDGEAAGQTVHHFHLHIILDKPFSTPVWYPKQDKSDEEVVDSKSRSRLSPQDMSTIVTNLRNYF